MITTSELAGFFAAHAIWSLYDSETFDPIFAYTTETGERNMERLIAPDMGKAVEIGRARLETAAATAGDGVLVFDGRISGDNGKLDAVIIEMRCYAFPGAMATLAVPYTPQSTGQFRVHKPKLLRWEDCDDFDMDAAFEAFFRGVDAHEHGGAIWNKHLDQSK
jgi:hypothetical protein